MTTDREPFFAHCGDCGHQWVAATYPMDLRKFAEIAQANAQRCAMCGAGSDRIFCGKAPVKEGEE